MKHFAYFNGAITPVPDVKLDVNDLGFSRGYGLFDYCRTYNSRLFMLDRHLDRFFHSAEKMQLPVSLSRDEIKKIISDIQSRVDLPDIAFRLLLTGGIAPDSLTFTTPTFVIKSESPGIDFPKAYPNGIAIITTEHLRELPCVKSTNYIKLMVLRKNLETQNVQDVLYTWQGKALELSRSNLFIVKDGTLITPKDNILLGVTRNVVLDLAKNLYPVLEQDITVPELLSADEVFTTGTGKRVTSITRIDDKIIGNGVPGPITRNLLGLFDETTKN